MEVQDCEREGGVLLAVCDSDEGAEGGGHLGDFCGQGGVFADRHC